MSESAASSAIAPILLPATRLVNRAARASRAQPRTCVKAIGVRADDLTVGPSDFLIYVCSDCGSFDWAWEEIEHRNFRCPGRKDVTRIHAVIAEVREVVPIVRVDVHA